MNADNKQTAEEKKETVENSVAQDIEADKRSYEAREEELAKWEAALSEKESSLKKEELKIQQEKAALEVRKKNAESELEQEIDTKRTKAKAELYDEQNKLRKDLNKELNDLRKKAQAEMDNERKNQENELKTRREEAEQELKEKRRKNDEDIKVKRKEVERKEADIEKREDDLQKQNGELEREKRRLDREKSKIEEAKENLETEVNQRSEDTIKNLEQKIADKDHELDNLRQQLSTIEKENESVKSFKEVYGDDPQILRQKLDRLRESNKELRDELVNCIDRSEYDNLSVAYRKKEDELSTLREEYGHLCSSKENYPALEAQFKALESTNKSLQATCESLENQLEAKNKELVRLSTPEGREAEWEKRVAAINKGALDDKKDLIGAGEGNDSRTRTKDEVAWLESVWSKCENYGIKFNKRILYAFHTALKINEWSTITVLAGVSGTGKSELPRLYAEFGGLNFCSVAVQPNWDSQESMLGFFNSIDNKFEPEEVLKFLVQCTTKAEYKDYMSIVLLDEMNLAHVEHYFAEFLSKLESRRGLSENYLPEVQVKLGAGVEPYGLKLSKTLLWTGTMNQDETTKSLSDKVLDRGIVINFPRPRKLESRTKMGLITDYIGNDRPKMHKSTWESWTSHEIDFSEEQMKELESYRLIVQKINDALEEVGRALGHRVWQSIEYYIANYPTVRREMRYVPKQNGNGKTVWVPTNTELTGKLRAAMKTAFEDQIVQKIMPKLRGIETRDKRGKSSLDAIEDLLVTHDFANLQEDFQIAREQGYGQFIWNSAKYLDEKEEESQE